MIEIREAREEDRESAIRILWKAFEATTNYEEYLKKEWIKRWNNSEKENYAYVAVDNGKVVSSLSFFTTSAHEQVIRGAPVRFAGVWAVTSDAAYRRKGLVRKLFDISFPRMREEKAPLSILDPFYKPLYEKFSYALAEKRARHVFTRDQIRAGKTREDITSREAKDPEDRETIQQIEKSMVRFGSRFFSSSESLDYAFKNGITHILEDKSGPVGCVWFNFTRGPPLTLPELTVGMSRYMSDDVFPSIVELVRNYSANVSKITWWADTDAPVRHYFSDIHRAESYMLGSMMMRVIDFEGYCQSIKIPEETTEKVTIELSDDQCPWNNGVYTLVPDGGNLKAERGDSNPDISLNAFQLSEMIGGITPPTLLRSLQEIKCDAATARKLEDIFPADTFVSYVRF
ncbi:MAG: enhanced intracellular survival protein Eis [Candidatus Thorarchaeota archaeon]